MKVSVCMITYNHEKFITQAVESVMMQQTNFDYELVIGEDCSTDRTREIAIELQKRYPDKIRLLLPEKNLGMQPNFVQTLEACRGKYTALVEGDDYWTSPAKLQRQVDFLDSHPDLSECFHSTLVVHEDGSQDSRVFAPPGGKKVWSLEDFLFEVPIATCSTMFRKGLFGAYPEWFYKTEIGDWALHMLNAQHGKVGHLDEVMSVYRVHYGGVWSSLNQATAHQQKIRLLRQVDEHFGWQHHQIIKRSISNHLLHLAQAYEQAGLRWKARKALRSSVKAHPLKMICDQRQVLSLLVRLHSPPLHKFLRIGRTHFVLLYNTIRDFRRRRSQ